MSGNDVEKFRMLLAVLPEVFSSSDIVKVCGLTRGKADYTLMKMRQLGLIEPVFKTDAYRKRL